MKATIKTYKVNAELFYNDKFYTIDWDGMCFDDKKEAEEWADEVLEPASNAENYEFVKQMLLIAIDERIK